MSVSEPRSGVRPFLLALILGSAAAWVAITFGGQATATLAAVPLAGIAAGATARRSVPALLGLLGGVVVPVTIVSLQYLLGKIAQCPQNDCGISGPGLTAVIVGVIISGAALIAMAGFAAGRIVRRRFPSWPGL